MAISVRMLVQIVLMILVGRIEIEQRQFLYRQWLRILALLFGIDFLDGGDICLIRIIDAGAVTGSLVVPLLVQTRRVNRHKEHT